MIDVAFETIVDSHLKIYPLLAGCQQVSGRE